MKILIPYDGSENAENALRDLSEARFAGGGSGGDDDRHEVLVVVSDVWLPETEEEFFRVCAARQRKVETSGACSYIPARRKLEEERFLCREASERLSSAFPTWKIGVVTLPGMSLPASEILERAEIWGADLIILGSNGDFAAAQTVRYGTQAARIAREASCAVRITGGKNALNVKAQAVREKIRYPELKVSKAAAIG